MTEAFEDSTETDHEMILLLKKEIEDLTHHLDDTEIRLEAATDSYHDTAEQLALHEKLSAQHGILKSVFWGVISLIMMMGILVLVGWFTKQTTIEREMAFFERILLVLIGIVGGAVSSFFDVRNFTISTKNGNGMPAAKNNNNAKDSD